MAAVALGPPDSLAAKRPPGQAANPLDSLARSHHHAALQAQSAAAKKKKVKKKTCQVKIKKNGKLVVFRQPGFKYVYVKRHGRRVRVRRRVLLPLYSACPPPPCIKQKVIKGKIVPATKMVTIKVRVRKNGRLVTVKRKVRRYVIVACGKPAAGKQPLGTPVTITVDKGSYALLDFVAFQRKAALTGSLKGYIVGGLQLGSTNQIVLTSGTIHVAQTPIFIDNDCNGQVSASIETGTPTTISLDPTQSNTSTLGADGTITSIVHVIIDLPLLLRNGSNGCTQPYLQTGYDQERTTFFLLGKFTGLSGDVLSSAPQVVTFGACLSLSAPTVPCTGYDFPIDVLVSNHLIVDIGVGS